MKSIKFIAMACLTLGLMACGSEQKNTFTFVQYNVGVFDKYEGSGFDAVANAVRELGADAVTLNEVDSCTTRTGSVDQLAVFADTMGQWHHHYASAMPYKGGAYGVGVAAKPELEVVRTDKVALPRLDGHEPRAVAVVEFKDFILCSTHLDLTLESQLGQIEVLNHYVDSVYADCSKPVFLGGDFNAFPDSETVALMKESWELLSPEVFSFPSHAPDRCIDYIFVRPNGKKVTVESASIPMVLTTSDLATASDHLPVALTVTIE
jgi:endonuclease/exonuclease/phosphatase family metal-dependent hydrolase